MFVAIHWILVALYIALPAVALVRAIRIRVRHRIAGPLRQFWLTVAAGMIMGGVVCGAHAAVLRGRVVPTQIVLSGYFATSLLLLLKGADALLAGGLDRLLRVRGTVKPNLGFALRFLTSRLLRAMVLLGVGLPYVLAACLTYRTRVNSDTDPRRAYGWNYDDVTFTATDGVRLRGWYIPAAGSTRTVLFCPGTAGTKASQLFLLKQLVRARFNVLTFDFRGVGDSRGQLISFGALEQRDVLGAVHFLKSTRAYACEKLYGLGVSTGGAALLGAAADASADGQAIDAVAMYSAFDRLDRVTFDLVDQYVTRPWARVLTRMGLFMASAQTGADLRTFAPARSAEKLWPRPLLVLQAVDDPMIDFSRGQALYDHALQPKYNDWVEKVTHEGLLENENAARFVVEFFQTARTLI